MVTACTLESSLSKVAYRMWLGECGAVPVVDDHEKVVGIITDRDICFAVAVSERPAAEILAKELVDRSTGLFTCRADDDVEDALGRMREQRVRRLPVVDADGRLEGILSMTDAIRHASAEEGAIPCAHVIGALQALGEAKVRRLDEAELHA
jgi:CBS domain-containing protein